MLLIGFSPTDAQATAEEDWAEDSKGADSLGREGFMTAIFKLADVWARTIEEEDYLYFLRRLFAGVATSDESECA